MFHKTQQDCYTWAPPGRLHQFKPESPNLTMADIFDTLVEVLCPTPNSASRCFEAINQYQAQQGDLQALIFFLFFPTLTIILFVWIFMHNFEGRFSGKMPKGLSLLVALGVYLFIILQGYYSIAITVSEAWIIVLVGFGLWWFVTKQVFGSGGDKAGGLSGLGGRTLQKALKTAQMMSSGERQDIIRDLEVRIRELEKDKKKVENQTGQQWAEASAEYRAKQTEVRAILDRLERDTPLGRNDPDLRRLRKQLEKI